MIRSVQIGNFRGFRSLNLDGLARINIIVGKNSSGKTSFLEALMLASGNAASHMALDLNKMRQLDVNTGQITPALYKDLWTDLFFDFDVTKAITIDLTGDADDSRSMNIAYSDKSQLILGEGHETGSSFAPQIEFSWVKNAQTPQISRPRLLNRSLVVEGLALDHFPIVMFGPSVPDSSAENARRFSDLSKLGHMEPIQEALKQEFPTLGDLSIEFLLDSPAVFAKVIGQQRKLPIALISDGMNKLLGLLLAIAGNEGGTILIDQIEDGFYFERLPSIWRLIYKFALRYNCQIFATTHSKECIDGMLEIVQDNSDDFALLKSARDELKATYRLIRGKTLLGVLRQGFDPR